MNGKTSVWFYSGQAWVRVKVGEEVLRKRAAAEVPSEPAGRSQLGPRVSAF